MCGIYTSARVARRTTRHTYHIFKSLFVASFASSFVALALEAVFRTRVKGDEWRFILCVCSYACENSSFAQRQRHTNVPVSGEARRECVNALLHVTIQIHKALQCTTNGANGASLFDFGFCTQKLRCLNVDFDCSKIFLNYFFEFFELFSIIPLNKYY